MSHTPGPWKYQRLLDAKGEPYATLYQAHIDLDVCMVWAPEGNKEQEANARLIAAAPDLLEACEALLSHSRVEPLTDMGMWEHRLQLREIEDKARSAIKKARGE